MLKFQLKKHNQSKVLTTILLSLLLCFNSFSTMADTKPTYRVGWVIYVGWMPWGYADSEGILKKWADKYDINIEIVQFNDYIESINQYTAGEFDAMMMANMDALSIPAASGIDSTITIVGHYSNGNDAIILKDKKQLSDIKGQDVNLVELSASHYMLARALETVGMTERDIRVVNTSDADLIAASMSDDVTAITTWNPLVAQISEMPNMHQVFSSAMIPGEILDNVVINTQTLNQDPRLGKALAGAWYEVMQIMTGNDTEAMRARSFMADSSGTDLAGYDGQLASTHLFSNPQEAVDFTKSESLKDTMQRVADFSFKHGLLGEGAPDSGFVGIETPAGVIGRQDNIKLRFSTYYMQLAADDKL